MHGTLDWRVGASHYDRSRMQDLGGGRSVCLLELEANNSSNVFLFVHGSMASMAQYFPAAAALHDEGKGFGCVAYDWYGCGRSPKPERWEARDGWRVQLQREEAAAQAAAGERSG